MAKPQSLKSLQKQFDSPKNVNVIHKKELSSLEKLAVFVTEKIGTMGFFFLILGWTILWLGWNIFAPLSFRFDPYPAFVLWLFISNLIQIHLMPLIMIGQNIQGKHAELRAQYDFDTDRKAEHEIQTILAHLELQSKMLEDIAVRLSNLEKKR